MISRTNTSESGSINRPASTWNRPTEIQSNMCSVIWRWLDGSFLTEKNSITA